MKTREEEESDKTWRELDDLLRARPHDATISIDGKKVGTARKDGQGGWSFIRSDMTHKTRADRFSDWWLSDWSIKRFGTELLAVVSLPVTLWRIATRNSQMVTRKNIHTACLVAVALSFSLLAVSKLLPNPNTNAWFCRVYLDNRSESNGYRVNGGYQAGRCYENGKEWKKP